MEQKKIIGENIKAARKLKGLSQRALAEKLGIAFQNLSVWENGKGAPSARYLLKLSEVLDVSLDQITTPSGIMATAVRSLERPTFGQTDFGYSRLPESSDLGRTVQRELADNHSLKLAIAYLEEILGILRGGSQGRFGDIRRVAESSQFGYQRTEFKTPLPPGDLSPEERLKWERNAAALLKWSQSTQSFWVPGWALEEYCRQIDAAPFGVNPEDVTRQIRSLLEKGKTE